MLLILINSKEKSNKENEGLTQRHVAKDITCQGVGIKTLLNHNLMFTSTEDLEELIACSTEYKHRSLNLAVVGFTGLISPGYNVTVRLGFLGSCLVSPSADIMNAVKRDTSSVAAICTGRINYMG